MRHTEIMRFMDADGWIYGKVLQRAENLVLNEAVKINHTKGMYMVYNMLEGRRHVFNCPQDLTKYVKIELKCNL